MVIRALIQEEDPETDRTRGGDEVAPLAGDTRFDFFSRRTG